MRHTARPWILFLLLLIATGSAAGYGESRRRVQAGAVAEAEQRVDKVSQQVNALRIREQRLAADQAERAALYGRLLSTARGEPHRQILMALVDASRTSGARVSRLDFRGESSTGSVVRHVVEGTFTGTEPQLLEFVRLLETGRPLMAVGGVTWIVPVARDRAGQDQGSIQLELSTFGPVQPETK